MQGKRNERQRSRYRRDTATYPFLDLRQCMVQWPTQLVSWRFLVLVRSYVRQNVASFRRRSSLRSMPSRHRILSLKTAAMSVSLLSRRVAGLSLRSAGACVGASPAVTAVSSLSTIAGSGGPSAATTLVSASPATAASASPCGGFAGSSQHAQRAAVQQVRFMSKKSKRSGGDDLVSCLVEPVISVACL